MSNQSDGVGWRVAEEGRREHGLLEHLDAPLFDTAFGEELAPAADDGEHPVNQRLSLFLREPIALGCLFPIPRAWQAVSDIMSDSRERRRAAQRFLPDLLVKGWMPLLCWHHIEELLQHRDDHVVDARLSYFWSQPLIAWIRPVEPSAGPGSIIDILRAEVAAAIGYPSADAAQVRDLAGHELIAVGAGADAIPESFRDWRLLREALTQQQQNARRVTAIARWRATQIDDTPISAWMNQPARDPDATARMLGKIGLGERSWPTRCCHFGFGESGRSARRRLWQIAHRTFAYRTEDWRIDWTTS